MPKLVVGISGVARSGKDTFCQLLIQELQKRNLRGQRFALADRLKSELYSFIHEFYDIDIFDCTPEDKELVRPFLVFHGKVRRIRSKGKHWTEILQQVIELTDDIDVAIVTDVRYDQYPEDELHWIRESMNGILVHITRAQKIDLRDCSERCALENGYTEDEIAHGYAIRYIQPPNEDEAVNDPKLQAKADFRVAWETGDIEGHCRQHVQRFVKFLEEKKLI